MHAEILDKQRDRFNFLAAGWLRVGAVCVQLLERKQILIAYPDACPENLPALYVSSRTSDLRLRVYGIDNPSWVPAAESMLEVFADLLIADSDLESLTAALVETQDRLVALYELAQATRRTLEVPVLLDLLIEQSKHLLNVDGGFAILMEKGKKPILHQVSEKPLHPADVEAAALLYRRDPSRHVFKDAETVPVDLRNVMMVSMPVRNEVFAALGVINKTGNYNTPDIKLAEAIAGHIGAQLENAMLHREVVERARLETELDIARQIQTAILPQAFPRLAGLDIYASSAPAFEVGGDFFDAIDRSKDSLVFAIGDVTGKGMPAALLMSMAHTVIKSAARNMPFTQPHQVLDRLNEDMYNDFSNVGMFTTVFVGELSCPSYTLNFSNAGHSPIYYLPAGREPRLVEAQDIPIGVMDSYQYTSQSIQLSSGDIFIAASDGFPEARNPAGEMFGYERIAALFTEVRGLAAREIVEHLRAAVKAFAETHPQDDDQTVIVIKVTH